MNELLQKFYAQRSEREITLHNLREQIRQDEYNLQKLNETISAIRQDLKDLKRMIAYLKENFTS
ncbi:MAG: hypothetical protein IKT98_06575 [Selenomonadaceae bacterium]|nr:hypothetical protein [Selenomonadaceae bacterium]